MSLNAGSVSVDDDGNVSGSGLASDLYTSFAASILFVNPALSSDDQVVQKKGTAVLANLIAAPLISYLTVHAETTVTIHTTDSGLQQVGGLATDGPSSNKTLHGTLS